MPPDPQLSPGDVLELMASQVGDPDRLDALDEYVAADLDYANSRDHQGDLAAYKADLDRLHDWFSNLAVSVEDVVHDGDHHACRYTIVGTHTGQFMGSFPTGERVEIQGIAHLDVVNGEVQTMDLVLDVFGVLRQLDLL